MFGYQAKMLNRLYMEIDHTALFSERLSFQILVDVDVITNGLVN